MRSLKLVRGLEQTPPQGCVPFWRHEGANTVAEPVQTRLCITFPRLILTSISCGCPSPASDSQRTTLLSFWHLRAVGVTSGRNTGGATDRSLPRRRVVINVHDWAIRRKHSCDGFRKSAPLLFHRIDCPATTRKRCLYERAKAKTEFSLSGETASARP